MKDENDEKYYSINKPRNKKLKIETGNDPPTHVKMSIGIDSVYLQFKGINKFDVDRFCGERKMRYENESNRDNYQREWRIFLAGGQPITVVFHFASKTITFQIGKLMDYTIFNEQHKLIQDLMQEFSDRPVQVSRLDFAVDMKNDLVSRGNPMANIVGSTHYYNNKVDGTVFVSYDKASQLGIYSTPLTRHELRLTKKLGQWGVKNFIDDRDSMVKLAVKICNEFKKSIKNHTDNRCDTFRLSPMHIEKVLEDFIAFLHGGEIPKLKDHFKVREALTKRDEFLGWMKSNNIDKAGYINTFAKGRRSALQNELGIDPKTFKKAINFYKGIPNFKVNSYR